MSTTYEDPEPTPEHDGEGCSFHNCTTEAMVVVKLYTDDEGALVVTYYAACIYHLPNMTKALREIQGFVVPDSIPEDL